MPHFSVTSLTSIDHITLHNQPQQITVGSCGFYLAMALARLGADVQYTGLVGEDFDSSRLDPLRAAGAAVALARLPGQTARLDLTYDPAGNPARIIYDEGVGPSARAEDLPLTFWDATVLWLGTISYPIQQAIAQRAAPHQSVYLSTQGEFRGKAPELRALAPHLSLLFANGQEAEEFGFGGLARSIDTLLTLNPRLGLVITHGPRGAWYITAHQRLAVPAAPHPTIVNTTGAGDTFNAAFAFQLQRAAPPAHALQWATTAAALSMRAYAYFNLPTTPETDAALAVLRPHLPVTEHTVIPLESQSP